ncbi:MAG: CehA/McbA family metallohydrolase [Deltaproteobacteria bacterium]|nr:CehA/McbA family metallohydrolase [Deltaproteobacteria bacterium]
MTVSRRQNPLRSLRWLAAFSAGCLLGCPTSEGGKRDAHRQSFEAGRRGAARAFRVTRASDLVGGPKASGRIGDYRLDNGEVAFIISDIGVAEGFAESGGNVVDVGHPGRANDCLAQLFTFFKKRFPRQAIYDRLTIVSRGANRSDAVIRVEGHDSHDNGILVTTEYSLASGSNSLRIVTALRNQGTRNYARFGLGDAIQWGCVQAFAPGLGYSVPGRHAAIPYLTSVGDGVSYGYVAKSAFDVTSSASWSDPTVAEPRLHRGEEVRYERWFVVGDGDTASLHASIAQARGETWARLSGRILDETTRSPAARALVEVRRDGQPFAIARAHGDGRFELHAPAGTYQLRGTGRDHVARGEVSVSLRPNAVRDAEVLVSGAATVRYRVTERATNRTTPAKLTFEGRNGTPTPRFGLRFRASGAMNTIHAHEGEGTTGVPPGDYTVTASRGPRYDVAQRDIHVAPGQTAEFDVALTRVIDTPGTLCGDFHQHAERSADAPTSLRDRVITNLTEGLDILVATDHNTHTDYGPIVRALGAEPLLATVVGVEATTHAIGHFNAFPVRYDATDRRGGAPNVFRASNPASLFALLRADGDDRVIQVNHPRAGEIGYFDLFDKPDLGFDAIEVVNGKRVAAARRVMADWFAFLNRGHRFTAMGNSDTHSIYGQEPGYARTCVFFGHDDPRKVDGASLVNALKRQKRVVVTNGPWIDFTVDGAPIGSTLERKRGAAAIAITVRAPAWVDVDRVELIANGTRVWERPVPPNATPLRFSLSTTHEIARDTWFIVIASGSRSLAPVVPSPHHDATPFAFTNPIWVKVTAP